METQTNKTAEASIPPFTPKKRLENGLIDGMEYPYDANGRINWFKLVPEECLYINQGKKALLEKRLGKTFEEIQKSEVRDTDLVITLQGLRHLLDLRGYKSVETKLDYCGLDYAAATCKISFIPNLEEQFAQEFCASACAHPGNTNSFMKTYLVEAATNRAFCRAVRQFLKINTVSNEELGASGGNNTPATEEEQPTENPMDARFLLKRKISEVNKSLAPDKQITFETIKAKLVAEKKVKGAEDFKNYEDIPKNVIFNLMDRIDKKFGAA